MFNKISKRIGNTYSGDKIPKRTKWIYSTSGFGRDAVYTIVATFLLLFVQEAGHLSHDPKIYLAQLGIITALTIAYRIFDGLNDPFMGLLIEKVHFKTGKYKPWIFIGSATNLITVLALFLGPKFFGIDGWAFVGWYAVFYLLWGITFTINDISFWSMLPSLSSDSKERSKVTSLVLIFSYLGSFLASFCIPYLSQTSIGPDAYWIMAIVVGFFFLIGQGTVFFFCQEKERDEQTEKDREKTTVKDMFNILKNNKYTRTMVLALICYFIGTSVFSALMQNTFYVTIGYGAGKIMFSIFNIIQSLAIAAPMVFMPKILEKFSMRKVFIASNITMISCIMVYFFYGSPVGSGFISPTPIINHQLNPLYAVFSALILVLLFVAQGCIYNCLILMMTNTIEYNEYISGKRQESMIFSFRPLTAKLGGSLQQAVTFGALQATGVVLIMNKINDINSDKTITDKIGEIEKYLDGIRANSGYAAQAWGIKIFNIIIPAVLLTMSALIIILFYKIDEAMYEKMVAENNKRNHKSVKAK